MNSRPTNFTQDLILKVIDDYKTPDMKNLIEFWCDFVRFDEILLWCVTNNFTGKNLCEYVRQKHNLRPMACAQWILSRIDREKIIRPVIVGKDYIPR